MNNVPAWPDEPDSPPERELRPWVLIFYTDQDLSNPKKFWTKAARDMGDSFKKELKISSDIKRITGEVVKGASTDDEKLKKIANYCRTNIRNIRYDANGVTAEDRSKFKVKDGLNTGDTINSKIGRPSDINKLFVAMAAAAGLEAHGVRAASSDMVYFRSDLMDGYLLRTTLAAAKVGKEWKFFDVSNPYLPSGMVDADQEGMVAIV